MEFSRNIYDNLLNWKKNPKRLPLLVMGARQIGKTTVLKTFGSNEFDHLAYFNLEKQTEIHDFFNTTKDPRRIIQNLELLYGAPILPGNTLLVLDEIQECRDALIALKYFQEEMPELHIVCAGSLLGITMGHNRSFPVGKVEFLDMYPLTFEEYLKSSNSKVYGFYKSILEDSVIKSIPEAFFNPLMEEYKVYITLTGMPEAASYYLEHKEISKVVDIQERILRAYQLDFAKHTSTYNTIRIQQIWNSLPSQLAKENKKFIYNVVRSGARAREYEEAIQWLIDAGLVYKISKIETAGVPLKAYEDLSSFKLYVFETGMLMRLAELDPSNYIMGDQMFTHFKGSIAENYVASSLKLSYGKLPYYWTSDGKAEIDFIINHKGLNVPIEVKSGENTKSKSMAVYKENYNPALRVRISNLNLNLSYDMLNIPIFFSEKLPIFIDKVI